MNEKVIIAIKSSACLALLLCGIGFTSCKNEQVSGGVNEQSQREPFQFEKSFLKEGEEYPVEVKISIYDASVLPIGEYYRDKSQLESSSLTHEIQSKLGARCEVELDDENVKGKLGVIAAEDRDFSDVELNLQLGSIEIVQCFLSKYGKPVFFEIREEGVDAMIKVVVITVNKIGWKQMPMASEANLENEGENSYFIKPTTVVRSNNQRGEEKIEVCYYPLPQLIHEAGKIYSMEKVKPNKAWENCELGDEIVDLTPWFEEAIGAENNRNLWVYYNVSKRLLIGRADRYLDTSIRDFVMKFLENAPVQIGISAELILVDISSSKKIEAIKSLLKEGRARRLGEFSTLLRSGHKTRIALSEGCSVTIDVSLSDHKRDAYVLIDYKSKNHTFLLTDYVDMGGSQTLECGLNVANELGMKTILVLNTELMDSFGRPIKLSTHHEDIGRMKESNEEASDDPFGSGDPFNESEGEDPCSARFRVTADFEQLIRNDVWEEGQDPFEESAHHPEPIPLIIAPKHDYFHEKDLVKDISLTLLDQGVPLKKGHRVYLNISRNELCVFADRDTVDLIENLTMGGCSYPRRQYKPQITIYEVDSREEGDRDWDMTEVAISSPKLLARGGFVSGSGEIGIIQYKKSKIVLESSLSDDGYHADQRYEINLKTKDYKLSKSLEVFTSLDFPTLVELENTGKRSVVMVIEMDNGLPKRPHAGH